MEMSSLNQQKDNPFKDSAQTTEVPAEKKKNKEEKEKASQRVVPFGPYHQLTWRDMRDLEYAGRRPDPFRTSESYDEHGRLLNRFRTSFDYNYQVIATLMKYAPYELPPMPPPPTTPTRFSFETEYLLQKLQTSKCLYCMKSGHGTAYCNYIYRVPKDAPVGPGCELVCRLCESPFSGTCCGLDEGRAILKECLTCGTYGEHWPRECPRNKGRFDVELPLGFVYLDTSCKSGAPGNVEQKEPAEPASVKSSAVKDDDSEDDQDDEYEETPSKTGSKKRARASIDFAKTPVSAKKAKIDTDGGDKVAYWETPRTTEKGISPELAEWMASFTKVYQTPGGTIVRQRQV